MPLLHPLPCLAARPGETCTGQSLAGHGQGLRLHPVSFHWFVFSPSCVLLGQVTRGHRTLLLPCREFLQLLCSLAGTSLSDLVLQLSFPSNQHCLWRLLQRPCAQAPDTELVSVPPQQQPSVLAPGEIFCPPSCFTCHDQQHIHISIPKFPILNHPKCFIDHKSCC